MDVISVVCICISQLLDWDKFCEHSWPVVCYEAGGGVGMFFVFISNILCRALHCFSWNGCLEFCVAWLFPFLSFIFHSIREVK